MICKKLWNVIAMFYLCLVSTVQNTVSNWSNPICYPFLLTNEILNPLSSRKRTSLSCSNSVVFSCWLLWNFLEVQQVLTPSWRHTKLQRQKVFSPTNGLITLTKRRTQNFHRMMLSTLNFVAVTLLKPNTRTILTYWKVDWPQNKPLSNWNCQSHLLLELEIIETCIRYGTGTNELIQRLFTV